MSRPTEWIDGKVLKALERGELAYDEVAFIVHGNVDDASLTQVRRSLNRQRGKTVKARRTPAKEHTQRGPRPLLWSLK